MPELRFREVHSGCPLEVVPGDGHGALLIAADRGENINDIEGITSSQLGAAIGDAELAQVVAAIGFERNASRRGHSPEDLVEGVLVNRLDENLVVDSAQEGFVGQVVGVEVGGKDHHHFKGNLELHAVLQRKIVDAPVQRNDAAIEQIAGGNELASEVVNEEDAIVCLHLQRGGVNTGGLVQAQ